MTKASSARPEVEQGNLLDIYNDNTVFAVDYTEFGKLENPKIGTSLN